ncbi:MAG: ribosome biogenesis GTP-binding protein YihA/YsxC [Bacteroidota bacterium]
MIVASADFLQSNTDYRKCPEPTMPEYAFIGRSNVGKSSLINMLVNQKKLALTSSRPGKTQLINHFIVNKNWYLVDLPGFGFAKVSKTSREKWKKMISEYLEKRENLMVVFLLIDSRIPPQQIDLDFINMLAMMGLPFVLAFTKTDKVSKTAANQTIDAYKKLLSETWETLPQMFFTSAEKKIGRDEILDYIGTCNKLFSTERNSI